MEMKKVEYVIQLTGSKLFDIIMHNTAKKLCDDFPGLNFEYDEKEIRVFGELNEYWYEQYEKVMFGKGEE